MTLYSRYMSSLTSYVREIKSINDELKRLRERTKKLNAQKKLTEKYLYDAMGRFHYEEYEGIKRDKIKPKDRIKRLKAAEKKEAALRLFHEQGIPDPYSFWESLQETQKPPPKN
jgi:hypothetical protein